jgi:hypothetical protein
MAHTNITRLDLHAAISVALLIAAVTMIAAVLLLSPAAHAETGLPACSARGAGSLIIVAMIFSVFGYLVSALLADGSRS